MLRLPRFEAGQLTTNLIEETFPDGYDAGVCDDDQWQLLAAVALVAQARVERNERQISGQLNGDKPATIVDLVAVAAQQTLAANS